MKFGMIGCGLMGRRRAGLLGDHQLMMVADAQVDRAEDFAHAFSSCEFTDDWKKVACHPEIDVVLVSTYHNSLAEISISCLTNGKHVLVDKPAAVRAEDLEPVIAAASEFKRKIRVGFNLRYHPAIKTARQLVNDGTVGPLLYVRGRYGHGGRLGYEKEWRADPELSGGGELLDQGVHLIDLSRWFLGDFTQVEGHIATCFWDAKVEDNAFLSLRTASNQTAWLHASWTEWKNCFSFEIFGRDGKLQIDGLGGSYGREKLTLYRMTTEMGPPVVEIWEYDNEDSLKEELDALILDIENDREPSPGLLDSKAALAVVQAIYAKNSLASGLSRATP